MPLITLADYSHKLLKPFSGMTDGQLKRGEGFRRDSPEGLFIGESARVIERALDAGIEPLAVLGDSHWLHHDREIVERILSEWPEASIFQATPQQFREITGYEVVRGVLAAFRRPMALSAEAVISDACRIAILEDVTNYANMGALFRSAAALGLDGILISPSCHDPYYRRCARVSMGAVFQIPWARFTGSNDWAAEGVAQLHNYGFKVAALALSQNALDLKDPVLKTCKRLALVLGTEGEGLRQSTIEKCDYTVCIPMAHQVDSLNVAACGAIAFWELGAS